MNLNLLKPIYFIPLFFLVGQSALAQSGLGGLGAGLSSSPSQVAISKKVIEITPVIDVNTASMNDFLALENKCKSGDAGSCVYAGKIMMLDKPPQEIFNLSSTRRANRAIRLYETAISVNMNLEAMELVYDLYYDKNLIDRQLNSYTDKDRAKELMDQMLAKNYPGGQIRQARDYIEDPEYALSIGKKKEACATARSLSNKSDVTPSTKAIVGDLLSGNICAVYNK